MIGQFRFSEKSQVLSLNRLRLIDSRQIAVEDGKTLSLIENPTKSLKNRGRIAKSGTYRELIHLTGRLLYVSN